VLNVIKALFIRSTCSGTCRQTSGKARSLEMGVSPALVITKRIDEASPVVSAVSSGGGTPVEPTWACETVAGVGGFEWREGRGVLA
jgi:hypothetical protein